MGVRDQRHLSSGMKNYTVIVTKHGTTQQNKEDMGSGQTGLYTP